MMKRLINHGIVLITIAALAFLSFACTITPAPVAPAPAPAPMPVARGTVMISHEGRFGGQVEIPVKDFEPVGLVFTEAEYWIAMDDGSFSGNNFTFQALLREAERLGAHAIVNIVMDRRAETVGTGMDARRHEKWFGSALAIRYTANVINPSEVFISETISFASGGSIGASSTGTVVISNDGAFGEHFYVPVKNFEGVGLVFTEAQYEIDTMEHDITGDPFTYYALLKEAQRVGAHAIINVVKDRRVESVSGVRKEIWSVSALAIRYTNTLRKN